MLNEESLLLVLWKKVKLADLGGVLGVGLGVAEYEVLVLALKDADVLFVVAPVAS